MHKNTKRYILWTGGWDSSYRLVELSFQDLDIVPVYVIDPDRYSKDLELAAMDKIIKVLQTKDRTRAHFSPLIKIEKDNIPKNAKITNAYKRFSLKTGLGSQHDWLARLALQYPMMELCIEKVTSGHRPVREAIDQTGKLIKTEYGYVIDKENSDSDLQLLFGNFTLPIFEKTEIDMLKNIKKWGYEDVMKHIWFCHRPQKGKPCGVCNPCCTKIDSKMRFLFSKKALAINSGLNLIIKIFGDRKIANVYRHLVWRYKK